MSDQDETRVPLERLLGSALSNSDGPPRSAIEAATALFDMIDVDAQLARMIESETAPVRDQGVRQVTFEWDSGPVLHLQIGAAGQTTHLTGFLEGDPPTAVVVQFPGSEALEPSASFGSFEATFLDQPWFRVLATTAAGRLVTPWIAGETLGG